MSLFFLFVLFFILFLSWVICYFFLLSSFLFSVYCPTMLEQNRNNKNNKRPQTSEHWHFGIPLSLPMPFETFFGVLFHFFSLLLSFWCLLCLLLVSRLLVVFKTKFVFWVVVDFWFFFFWGFKGQVRWPFGPPHLALNPLYICCRKRIQSNLSLLEVKFGCLEVTRFYF